jgi:hypothetical protein
MANIFWSKRVLGWGLVVTSGAFMKQWLLQENRLKIHFTALRKDLIIEIYELNFLNLNGVGHFNCVTKCVKFGIF